MQSVRLNETWHSPDVVSPSSFPSTELGNLSPAMRDFGIYSSIVDLVTEQEAVGSSTACLRKNGERYAIL